MRRLQFLLLLAGLVLFVLLLRRIGVSTIAAGLAEIGASFLALFAVELTIDALHAEGWRHCLPRPLRIVPRLHLVLVRTAGVGINVLTPSATVGGEVVKGMLVRRWIPAADGFASIMVDKLTFAAGQAMFILVGLAIVLSRVPLSARERAFATLGAALWVLGVVVFFVLQRRGLFGAGVGALRAIFGGKAMFANLPDQAAELDEKVRRTLETGERELVISSLWHFAGQASRIAQFWIALTALGLAPTATTAVTAAAGFVFLEATLFLVPGKLGVLELGYIGMFAALGIAESSALTVAFALRLSELASALVGLGALGGYHLRGNGSAIAAGTERR